MPNYWYIRHDGTANNSTPTAITNPTVKRTGAWSSDPASYYPTMEAPQLGDDTVSPAPGDFMIVANDHAEVRSGTYTMYMEGGYNWISCDVNNQENFSEGGKIDWNVGFSFAVYNPTPTQPPVRFAGITFAAGTGFAINSLDAQWYFTKCTIQGKANGFVHNNQNARNIFIYYKDCKLIMPDATSYLSYYNGAHAKFVNLQAGAGHVKLNWLFRSLTGNPATVVEVWNTDLSQIIKTGGALFKDHVSGGIRTHYKFRGCLFPDDMNIFDTAPVGENFLIDIAESAEGSAYYNRVYWDGRLGIFQTSTANYLTDTYDGVNGISMSIISTANVAEFVPFEFEFWARPAVDLRTAKTLSIEIIGPAGLLDNEVYFDVYAQDNTNKALTTLLASTKTTGEFETGTALTGSSAAWNTPGDTPYILSVDLPTRSNVDNTNLLVRFGVAKPSVSMFAAFPKITAT